MEKVFMRNSFAAVQFESATPLPMTVLRCCSGFQHNIKINVCVYSGMFYYVAQEMMHFFAQFVVDHKNIIYSYCHRYCN